MTTSKSQLRAGAKYDAANTKRLPLKLNLKTDADIFAILDAQPNKQGFVKAAIRAYAKAMETTKNEEI